MNALTHMLPYDMQLANEHRFNRKHIDGYLRTEIKENPDNSSKLKFGIELINEWMQGTYYESKNKRIEQLKSLDIEELVLQVFVQTAYCQIPELFTSVTAQLAGRLKFSDKPDAITTIAEIVGMLCFSDAFDVYKEDKMASMMVQSNLIFSERVRTFISNATFLPPMVCAPNYVANNHTSGHLTHNDSLILGKGNHHDGDICLDVINLQNSIPLQLDVPFLKAFEMRETRVLDSAEKIEQWRIFKDQSHELMILLINQGNKFYFTHKVDKRGRLYSVGYHINTQGSAFQKAMIELAEEELVEGV